MIIQNVDKYGMKRLKEIRENQYRSKDNRLDYCPFSIEARINELATKQAAKFISGFKEPKNNPIESIFIPPQFIKPRRYDNKKELLITRLNYIESDKTDAFSKFYLLGFLALNLFILFS